MPSPCRHARTTRSSADPSPAHASPEPSTRRRSARLVPRTLPEQIVVRSARKADRLDFSDLNPWSAAVSRSTQIPGPYPARRAFGDRARHSVSLIFWMGALCRRRVDDGPPLVSPKNSWGLAGVAQSADPGLGFVAGAKLRHFRGGAP